MSFDSHTENEVRRMFNTPRIVSKWRGVCDGLPEFVETCHVRLNGSTLFSGTRVSCETFLFNLLNCGRFSPVLFAEGAGV